MFLRGFTCEPGKPFLWRYLKSKAYHPGKQQPGYNPALQSTLQVSVQRDYFAHQTKEGWDYSTTEKKLVPLETKYALSLRAARNLQPLRDSDKENIIGCIELLYKRAQPQRGDSHGVWPGVRDNTLKQFESAIKTLESDPNTERESLEIFRTNLHSIFKERLSSDEVPSDIMNSLLFQEYNSIRNALRTRHWTWLIRTDRTPFICSDNPVCFHRSAGLKKSDLSIPISSNLALFITENQIGNAYERVPDSVVRMVNRRTVQYAHEEAYACVNEEWILKLLKKAPCEDRMLVTR